MAWNRCESTATSACLIGAGIALSACSGGAAAPALLAAFGGFVINRASSAVDRAKDQAERERQSLFNHDLARAAGVAVRRILTKALPLPLPSGEQSPLRDLVLADSSFETVWMRLTEHGHTTLVPALAEESLHKTLFSRIARGEDVPEEAFPPTRDESGWNSLILQLLPALGVQTSHLQERFIQQLAQACDTSFAYQFYRALKDDAADSSRAFAGVTLRMLGEVAAYVHEHSQQLRAMQRDIDTLLERTAAIANSVLNAQPVWLRQRLDVFAQYLVKLDVRLDRIDKKLDESAEREKRMLAILEGFEQRQKQPGTDPTKLVATEEELAAARELAQSKDALTRARAAIVLKNWSDWRKEVDAVNASHAMDLAFQAKTVEGDGFYAQGKFDDAIGPYEVAFRLQDKDVVTRNNLALALTQARLGNRTLQKQRAIEIYSGTLELPHLSLADWTATKNNRGAAWGDLSTPSRPDNLRRAIADFSDVLTKPIRDSNPMLWAAIQNNLGIAWALMPTENKAQSLLAALGAFSEAKKEYTRDAVPLKWAMIQSNIGEAWRQMPAGTQAERADNLQKAIHAFSEALMEQTREAAPMDWAMTLYNLGNAWLEIPTGSRADNLQKAINAYTLALEVRTRETAPMEWAATLNHLGIALARLPTDSQADRAYILRKAIAAYTEALMERTRAAAPLEWAATHYNLALAFAELAELPGQDHCGLIRRAIACSKAALQVFTREAALHDHEVATKNMAMYRRRYEARGCDKPETGGPGAVPFDAIAPAE